MRRSARQRHRFGRDRRHPITQLCANKSRNTIYIQYKHPTEDRPFEATVVCDATVDVR
jgi:hypothetical protein